MTDLDNQERPNPIRMSDEKKRFHQIEAIFEAILVLPDEVRASRLDELCQSDRQMLAEVQSLLTAYEEENAATGSLRQLQRGQPEPSERRGIGPYQLESLLGRGGMGAVYLAHRADGQYEKKVAIKLIDLPLTTNLLRDRFRRERQILAGLNHPLIARMLDGGISNEGELYLVMEYVAGEPINVFCTQNNLSLQKRLRLFMKVCGAVQYAHQNLIVHRDLKPDNILVDAEETPHLLDFGTAKILSASEAEAHSAFTREGFLSFTPQYASPEQILGKPITTASDTYSLGILLYQLLTNTLPYELKEFSTDEMVRVVCQQAPRRAVAAAEFNASLGLDLEAILGKALRKEPEERYRSAEQLESDVRAYLENRPVSARGDTARYKAAKFAKRNQLAISAAILLTLSLVAGIAGTTWQARIANRQRRIAEARSDDLRQLSTTLLSELDEAIKQIPGSTGAQQLLVTRVLEHLDRMSQDTRGDKATELDLVEAYTRLANLQGDPYEQNLGDQAGALQSLDKALRIAQPLATGYPKDAAVLIALGRALDSRGEILSLADDSPGAAASLKSSAKTYDQLLALPNPTPALFFEAADVYDILGDVMGQDTGYADAAAALDYYHKAIDMDNHALVLDPNFLRVRRGLSTMQMKIGNVELDFDPESALKDFRIAATRLEALPESERNHVGTLRSRALILRKQAVALSELGRYSQAAPLFQESLRIYQGLATADSKDFRAKEDLRRVFMGDALNYENAATPLLAAAPAQRHQNLQTALNLMLQEKSVLQQILQTKPGNVGLRAELANVEVHIGVIQQRLHDQRESEQQTKAALEALRNVAASDKASPMILDLTVNAFLLAEPVSLRDPGFTLSSAERGAALTHRKEPSWMLSLAQAYRAVGQNEKARATATEGLALLPAGAAGSRLFKLLKNETSANPHEEKL